MHFVLNNRSRVLCTVFLAWGLLFAPPSFGDESKVSSQTGEANCAKDRPSKGWQPSKSLGQLEGDVDGHGGKERIFIAFNQRRHDRCRFLLVVDGKRQSVTGIAGPARLAQASERDAPRFLRLHSLIALALRGLEIVVIHDQGASTNELGIYSLEGGTLHYRPINTRPATQLYEGGTVTRMFVTDCAGHGSRYVISSGAGFDGAMWRVSRIVFEATRSGSLRPVVSFSRQASITRIEDIAPQFPEFSAGTGRAFQSCAVARTPR